MFYIVIVGIVVAILIRTGSIGKAFGFLFRIGLYPILLGVLGYFVGSLISGTMSAIGCLAGVILGLVIAFKNGSDKMNGVK